MGTDLPVHASFNWNAITGGYFDTMSIPVLAGRAFADGDRAGSLPVAVVNRAFADLYFKNSAPIGKRVRFGGARSTEPWVTIVGIVVCDATPRESD
jgi:hypothetical protein